MLVEIYKHNTFQSLIFIHGERGYNQHTISPIYNTFFLYLNIKENILNLKARTQLHNISNRKWTPKIYQTSYEFHTFHITWRN